LNKWVIELRLSQYPRRPLFFELGDLSFVIGHWSIVIGRWTVHLGLLTLEEPFGLKEGNHHFQSLSALFASSAAKLSGLLLLLVLDFLLLLFLLSLTLKTPLLFIFIFVIIFFAF